MELRGPISWLHSPTRPLPVSQLSNRCVSAFLDMRKCYISHNDPSCLLAYNLTVNKHTYWLCIDDYGIVLRIVLYGLERWRWPWMEKKRWLRYEFVSKIRFIENCFCRPSADCFSSVTKTANKGYLNCAIHMTTTYGFWRCSTQQCPLPFCAHVCDYSGSIIEWIRLISIERWLHKRLYLIYT